MNAPIHIRYNLGAFPQVMQAIGIACLVSTILTASGMAVDAQTVGDVLKAVAFGIAVGGAISAGWAILLKAVTSDYQQRTRNALVAVTIVFLCFILAASSQYNALEFGGVPAKTAYLEDGIGDMQDENARTYHVSQELAGFQNDLALAIVAFEWAIKAEQDDGYFSGAPGTGAVHSALIAIKDKLRAIEHSLGAKIQELPGKKAASEQLLESMKKVMDGSASLQEKEKQLVSLSAQFTRLQSEMSTLSIVGSLDRQLSTLGEDSAMASNFSTNIAIREKQEAALTKLNGYVEKTMAPLVGATASFLAVADAPMKALRPISQHTAIYKKWRAISLYWLAAVSVDFFPAIIFAIMYISASSTSPQEAQMRSTMSRTSMYDYMNFKKMDSITSHYRTPSEALERLYYEFDHIEHPDSNREGGPDGEAH